MLNKLEATEMWFLRRMQRISYTEHVTNVEVIRRVNTKRKVINGKQAGDFFRTRHAQGREGTLGSYRLCRWQESSGPPEETYLTYLQNMKEKTPIELIHLTSDRGVWSELSNSSLRQHDMAP